METLISPQLRRADRLSVDIAATVFLTDHLPSPDGSHPAAFATIRNLSVSGALVRLPLLLYPSTRIRLSFVVKDRNYDKFATIARMVEVAGASGSFDYGVRFLATENSQQRSNNENEANISILSFDKDARKDKPVSSDAIGRAMVRPAKVLWNKLRIGDVLLADLQTQDGILLAAAGTEVTGPMLMKLTNHVQSHGIHEPIVVKRLRENIL